MEHYLCLTDLLDQDLSAYEYFPNASACGADSPAAGGRRYWHAGRTAGPGGPFAGLTFNRIEPTLSAGVFAGGKMEDAGTMA